MACMACIFILCFGVTDHVCSRRLRRRGFLTTTSPAFVPDRTRTVRRKIVTGCIMYYFIIIEYLNLIIYSCVCLCAVAVASSSHLSHSADIDRQIGILCVQLRSLFVRFRSRKINNNNNNQEGDIWPRL